MIGTSLGPYKIIEQLGAGGMGEVYLGEDTRLGRKVAIKVLPAEFASDPERLARFEQEARAAAALNHPHIAVVHDVGSEQDDDGTTTHFMVQEHLEGQSLGERLDKGALPLGEALDLSVEVGEALIAAHKAGIIHRDLKPDNIFVTEEGHAKVLDFGLAKLTEMAAPAGSELSMSPTMLGTVAGQIMGTAGYMAPEQVNGEEIDHRADLFAFGAVLYEMVTGRRAFVGRTVVETLSHIQHKEPEPLVRVSPALPGELQRIVKKSVSKPAGKRYQTAADLVVDLEALSVSVDAGETAAIASTETSGRTAQYRSFPAKRTAVAAAAGVVVGAAAVWLAISTAGRPRTTGSGVEAGANTTYAQLRLRDGLTVGGHNNNLLAISPDGRFLAYAAVDESERRLYLHDLGSPPGDPTAVPRSEGATTPFFDPSGQQLGFIVNEEDVYVWELGAVAPTLIGTVEGSRGAAWGSDGAVVVGSRFGGLTLLSANTRDPEPLTFLDTARLDLGHRNPSFLPDGRSVVFNIQSGGLPADAAIAVVSLDSKQVHPIEGLRGSAPKYVMGGHLLINRYPDIYAAPFDASSARPTGAAEPVLLGVQQNYGRSDPHLAVSSTGRVVYQPLLEPRLEQLVAVDLRGNVEPTGAKMADFSSYIRVSPDGALVATLRLERGTTKVWIYELATEREFTLDQEGDSLAFAWFPEEDRIAYGSLWPNVPGIISQIYSQGIRDSHSDVLIRAGQTIQGGGTLTTPLRAIEWSPDGKWLVIVNQASDGFDDLWAVPVDQPSAAFELVATPGSNDQWARLSPGGTWFVYDESSDQGRRVRSARFPENDNPYLVSTSGGRRPLISHQGDRVFYQAGRDIMEIQVSPETGEPIGRPSRLFTLERELVEGAWDLHPDGDRFYMLLAGSERPPADHLELIDLWFEELKERVPTGGR